MIDGHEQQMVDTLVTLMKTREQLKLVEKCNNSRFDTEGGAVYITRGEMIEVLKARIAEFESKAHNLGIHGPASKQNARGQAIATMHSANPRTAQ